MEPNNTSENLFELQIDAQSNNHLSQAAKWAKFLAIIGFVFCGLLIIWGIYMEIVLNSLSRLGGEASPSLGPLQILAEHFF